MGTVQLSTMVVSSTDSIVRFSGGIGTISGLIKCTEMNKAHSRIEI